MSGALLAREAVRTREFDVEVSGARLAGTLVAATDPGCAKGLLVLRTPYDRRAHMAEARAWARRGFAMHVQDVRGRYGSTGTWRPYRHERADGLATLDRLAQEFPQVPLVLTGGSYAAGCARAAADHPAVRAAISAVPAIGLHQTIRGPEGIPHLERHAWWWSTHGTGPTSRPTTFVEALAADPQLLEASPTSVEAALGAHGFAEAVRESADAADYGPFPAALPRLDLGGWWDPFIHTNWADATGGAAKQAAAHGTTIGPWAHDLDGSRAVGLQAAVPGARLSIGAVQYRWLAAVLSGAPAPLDAAWVGDGWLPTATTISPLTFAPRADGSLVPDPEPADGSPVPKPKQADGSPVPKPVPGVGSLASKPSQLDDQRLLPWDHHPQHGLPGCCWPVDVAADASHPDCLRFTSAPAAEPLRLLGPLRVDVAVRGSGGHSGPVVARVSVLRPDGAVVPLTQGVRAGTELESGSARISVATRPTGAALQPGESLVLDLAGGAHPLHPRALRPVHRALDLTATRVTVPRVLATPCRAHPWQEGR